MSSFQVSTAHIDALVAARNLVNRTQHAHLCDSMNDDQLGRFLIRANLDSLAAQYRDPVDEAEIAAYRFNPVTTAARKHSVVQLMKAAQCFAYQSCEVENWDTCDAKKFCDQLNALLIGCLPGYDEAAWGIYAAG